jgi:hypothetical protein
MPFKNNTILKQVNEFSTGFSGWRLIFLLCLRKKKKFAWKAECFYFCLFWFFLFILSAKFTNKIENTRLIYTITQAFLFLSTTIL